MRNRSLQFWFIVEEKVKSVRRRIRRKGRKERRDEHDDQGGLRELSSECKHI